MRKTGCALLLLLSLSTSIPAQGTLLTKDELALLLGSKTSYTKEEVANLLLAVVELADQEIRRTAEEAVKEAALQVEPETAFYKGLAESWQREAEQAGKAERLFKTLTIVEAVVIGGLCLYSAIREVRQ